MIVDFIEARRRLVDQRQDSIVFAFASVGTALASAAGAAAAAAARSGAPWAGRRQAAPSWA